MDFVSHTVFRHLADHISVCPARFSVFYNSAILRQNIVSDVLTSFTNCLQFKMIRIKVAPSVADEDTADEKKEKQEKQGTKEQSHCYVRWA